MEDSFVRWYINKYGATASGISEHQRQINIRNMKIYSAVAIGSETKESQKVIYGISSSRIKQIIDKIEMLMVKKANLICQ